MILSLIGSIVHFLVNAYILVLFIRMILDWVAVLASAWRPRGPIYFDVAFIVLYFILIAIDFLI